jgi:hypothetical protein
MIYTSTNPVHGAVLKQPSTGATLPSASTKYSDKPSGSEYDTFLNMEFYSLRS